MNVIVKTSKIHGKGVFAKREFKKGEIVIDWSSCSKQLTKEQFDKLPKKEKKYVSFIKNKYALFKSPGKYVNHSCNPNTKAKNNSDVAVINIKKGEEITANYVKEKVPGLNLICNCGSKKCKKLLKTIP